MVRRFFWALTARLTRAISLQSLYSGPGLLAQELLDDLGVLLRQHHVLAEPAGHARRLVLEVVAHARALLHHLAGAGDPEPLLGTGVRLLLGHYCSSSSDALPVERALFSALRAWASAFASTLLLCGPMIMTMFRPSMVGVDSTVPYSATSSAKRCRRRTPCSGRDCSRP